jgi:hypothetical protein
MGFIQDIRNRIALFYESGNHAEQIAPETWARFFRKLITWSLGIGLGIYILIVIIDPFDTLNLSPPLTRVPITRSGRFKFPALARSEKFDSVIIGTSTSRLLQPTVLNPLFEARFVNLAMDASTAYEQFKILDVFTRHHHMPKVVIIGIDSVWCRKGKAFEKYTPRPFPEWMYDDNPWNDYLNHFNLFTIEQAGRQLATIVGLRPVKYGLDGYTNFLPDPSEYDLEKARKHLYRNGPKRVAPVEPPVCLSEAKKRGLRFPAHRLLADALAALPDATQKIAFFPPYHVAGQPRPGSRKAAVLAECKSRVAQIINRVPNGIGIDFMIASPLTTEDRNYWDRVHYSEKTGKLLMGLLKEAVAERKETEFA